TESPVPAGYSSSGECTGTIADAPSGTGSCTIVNTLNAASFTVSKDRSEERRVGEAVSLTCDSGSVSPASASAAEATTGVLIVTGDPPGARRTATESPVPAGYSSSGECTGTIADAPSGTGSCTIVNTLNAASFTVSKD